MMRIKEKNKQKQHTHTDESITDIINFIIKINIDMIDKNSE